MAPQDACHRRCFTVAQLSHRMDQRLEVHSAAIPGGERSARAASRDPFGEHSGLAARRAAPVVGREQAVRIVEPNPRVDDREPRSRRSSITWLPPRDCAENSHHLLSPGGNAMPWRDGSDAGAVSASTSTA